MKKTKECKVNYVDNIEMDFKIECTEIKLYKIYGRQTSGGGYKLLATKNDKQKAIDYANNLNSKIYDGKIVIEHDKETDTDTPIDLER